MEKLQNGIVSGQQEQYKAGFYEALEDADVQSMRMCIAGLEETGREKKTVKSDVTGKCKPKYKELYVNGDEAGMLEMREALMAAGLGYTEKDFMKWTMGK